MKKTWMIAAMASLAFTASAQKTDSTKGYRPVEQQEMNQANQLRHQQQKEALQLPANENKVQEGKKKHGRKCATNRRSKVV